MTTERNERSMAVGAGLVTTLDPSWRSQIPWYDLVAALSANKRAAPHVRRYVFEHLGLDDGLDARFSRLMAREYRIADFEPAMLRRAVMRCGTCFFHQAVRAPISGPEVRRLIERLGEDVYDFAVNRGPELAQRFRIASKANGLEGGAALGDLEHNIRYHGMIVLATALEPAGMELLRRAFLKLPRAWSRAVLSGRVALTQTDALALFEAVLIEVKVK